MIELTLDRAKHMMEINGGSLYLRGTQIQSLDWKKVKHLRNGDIVSGKYIYCDNILTHIRSTKRVDKYTVYVGKIKGRNVVSDGVNYEHCDHVRDGIADLIFKAAKDHGAEQYRGLGLDTELTVHEAVTMYRVITGACRQGSENFVKSFGADIKEKYTIMEVIDLTKGQYNSEKFAEFFGQ